jgi:excisionase family DNA binding protein
MRSLVLSDVVLSVPEAAARLQVNAARVRALISANELAATKVGSRWLVSATSVEERRRSAFRAGRPLSPRRAWGLLLLASGVRPAWLDPPEVSRLRGWLKADRLRALAPRLRTRAVVHALRAHPSELKRLAPAVVLAGISAAAGHNVDLVPPSDLLDGYVRRKDLPGLLKRHTLEPSSRPNVVLRVVEGPWPFERGATVAPMAVVAADLLESADARERRAGAELLGRLAR